MSSTPAVLVVGADAMIGRALVADLRAAGCMVHSTSRRPGAALALDLARPASWPELPRVDAAILVAAVARLADCERDPETSRRVNAEAPALLARAMRRQGAWCLHLSTDKVFDGSRPMRGRDEPPCPLTEYGRQKAEAEAAVLAEGGAVLRLAKVLAPDLDLLQDWRRRLLGGEAVTPFSDLMLAPATAGFVAGLVRRLLLARAGGIFHCTGAEDRSYVALAEALASALGAEPALIRPTAAPAQMAGGVLVPHTTLEMSREQALFGLENPGFEETVREVAAAVAAAESLA